MKWMILVQQEILEKQLKEFRRLMNAIFQVIVICSDQCIPKIPCILSKNVICYVKTKRTQILNEEHGRRSGVSLTKYMDLPQSGYEYGKVVDDFIHRKIFIGKLLLL